MKKVMMLAAIVAALVSCQSKGTPNKDNATSETETTVASDNSSATTVYEGILPAADGPGIRYVLSIEGPSNKGKSDYTLVTTYIDAEGPGKDKSFTVTGQREVIRQEADNTQKTVFKLTPVTGDTPVYFMMVNDSTLRLVNDELQEAAGELNYDIIRVQ